jgi:hypothetical protein
MRADAWEGLQKLELPDRWQAEAIGALQAGHDVVVDAPTGAGKTFVFEKFIETCGHGRRGLFAVPTRALANDKFAEWRGRGRPAGLVTGDVTVDPDAPVVVATLEAAQSGLFPEPRFALLALDEYQMLGDPLRGHRYEGTVAALPATVQLLLLSGSVANPEDVVAWLGRLGRRPVLVRHRQRPVPLEEADADDLARGLPASIAGFWSRRVAGALRAGLGPVLVFAPQRSDAERLARQLARELPPPPALTLSAAQETALGPALARLLRQRVAYHHSGLPYLARAGVIEPLAKAGQLRAVVATLGLAAGINFSLRSVLVTAHGYRHGDRERELAPSELLQMFGRAGRRGLDETGYLLVTRDSPRLAQAAPLKLRRAGPLPWGPLLRSLRDGASAAALAATAADRFFAAAPIDFGLDPRGIQEADTLPCREPLATGRARLVRRAHRPFPGCRDCPRRAECLALEPRPTLFWQWRRLGLLDRSLALTPRGRIAAAFHGPEGLALAAALETRGYDPAELIFDAADLFGGDRFCGTNPRRLGRLAAACERTYRRFSVDGFLDEGLPPSYGGGAGEAVRGLVAQGARRREVLAESEQAGHGDLDRLLIEWRSLLRQIAAAAPLPPLDPAPGATGLAARWAELQEVARLHLARFRSEGLPELPPLSPEQRKPVAHRLTAPAQSWRHAS